MLLDLSSLVAPPPAEDGGIATASEGDTDANLLTSQEKKVHRK